MDVHLCVNFLAVEDDDHYFGINHAELTQFNEQPNQRFTNLLNDGNIQNPYYEGNIDLPTQENYQSNLNQQIPDFNDTAVVTSSQNIYNEL